MSCTSCRCSRNRTIAGRAMRRGSSARRCGGRRSVAFRSWSCTPRSSANLSIGASASNGHGRCDGPSFQRPLGVRVPPGKRRVARSVPEGAMHARKPSYTTLIYEARIRRVPPMTTAYDVPPGLLIDRLKDRLQQEGKIKPPEWAPFARTGVHTEKAPTQPDWWYRRVAAVLREAYLKRPVVTARLPAGFRGRAGRRPAPLQPRPR